MYLDLAGKRRRPIQTFANFFLDTTHKRMTGNSYAQARIPARQITGTDPTVRVWKLANNAATSMHFVKGLCTMGTDVG